MLERVPLAGHVLTADKGFAGADFEQWMANRGARFLRPDRKDEPRRHGSLGRVRQWIESVFWTCKGSGTTTTPATQHASSPPTDADYASTI